MNSKLSLPLLKCYVVGLYEFEPLTSNGEENTDRPTRLPQSEREFDTTMGHSYRVSPAKIFLFGTSKKAVSIHVLQRKT